MNVRSGASRRASVHRHVLAVLLALLVGGCIYDVPITTTPTRDVDPRLVGDWASADGKERVKVRPLDRRVYILSYNGDLFRAYHSDIGNIAFASVQDIDGRERKYAYIAYMLSADGQRLQVKAVNVKTIPDSVRSSAEVRRLLAAHASDPQLFTDEPLDLTRQK